MYLKHFESKKELHVCVFWTAKSAFGDNEPAASIDPTTCQTHPISNDEKPYFYFKIGCQKNFF